MLSKRIAVIRGQLKELLDYIQNQHFDASCLESLHNINNLMDEIDQEVLERSDRLPSYLDVAEVILLVLDEHQRVTLINRKGCDVLKRSEDQVLGRNWFDEFVPPKDREPTRTVFNLLMAGEIKPADQYENAVLDSQGNERVVAWRNSVLRDGSGKVVGTLSSGDDVTDRRQMQRDRDLLAHAIAQAGEAIIITDSQGTIQYVNPAFESITGFSRGEAVGQNPRILKSGKHAPEFYRQMWETLGRGEVWRGHMVNRRKDGVLYEQESTISPISDLSGRITNFVEVQRDVTAQVELEGRLRQAAKMEAVGRLAGGIAHDFNNQLTVIKGFCELMLADLPPGKLRDPVIEIRRAAERSATMTNQLLAFSRKQLLLPARIDLNDTLREMVKTLGRMIGEKTVLNLRLGENLGSVEADPGQLQQAVMNLALNARDAMPEGGTLTVETANVQLKADQVGADADVQPGPFVMLAISDTGSGMDSETLRHIFEPFFTTKSVGAGTGLGLSMVHGFVRQSGGRISVYSSPGRGTTFHIYLPRVSEPAGAAQPVEEAEPEVGGSETILVVEDEKSVLNLIVRLLGQRGWRVLPAANASQAIAISDHFGDRIHLLISDVVMPGMEGPELARRLKLKRPDMKVLFITGYAEHAALEQGLGQSGDGLLTKPFSPSALSRKIRQLLYEDAPAQQSGAKSLSE